jgi:energy-coupling factor transport system permease protein
VKAIIQDITIGGFLPAKSIIHSLDPRAKLIFTTLFMILVFSGGSIVFLAACSAVLITTILLTNIGVAAWLSSIRRFILMLLVAGGFNLFFYRAGKPLGVNGWETPFTDEGLWRSMIFVSQIAIGILASMALTFTTKPVEIARACESLGSPLKRLGVPVGEISTVILMAIRFVPILQMELRTIVEAQRSRGIDFAQGNVISRIRALPAVLMPAFSSALRRSDILATAMAARGYVPGKPRTVYRTTRIRTVDYCCFTVLICLAVFRFFS